MPVQETGWEAYSQRVGPLGGQGPGAPHPGSSTELRHTAAGGDRGPRRVVWLRNMRATGTRN